MDKQHLDTTLAVTQAMADELTDYLMGDNLYRQLVVKTPSGTKQPKMTIGALLESIRAPALGKGQPIRRAASRPGRDRANGGSQPQQLCPAVAGSSAPRAQGVAGLVALVPGRCRQKPEARENYAREVHIRTRIDLVMRALAGDASLADSRRQLGRSRRPAARDDAGKHLCRITR